ncbi:hypothetical protein [Microbispora sp. GKU 823]|nr:hypothetical protein [Microbispora sp. GKU 823]
MTRCVLRSMTARRRSTDREPHQADPVLAVQARQIGLGRRYGRRERRRP